MVPQGRVWLASLVASVWLMSAPSLATAAPLEVATDASVGGQSAGSLLASFPTNAQVSDVLRSAACAGGDCATPPAPFVPYAAYYGDRITGGFTMRPGFVSGVGAEYAATNGLGSLKISVSSYATNRQALTAAKVIARGAGIALTKVAARTRATGGWGPYDIWTGTSATGDQGVLYAIAGDRYVRFWVYPPAKQWSKQQWRSTLQGFSALVPQVMAAQQQVPVAADLAARSPQPPPGLAPVLTLTLPKEAWLPYGKPDADLFNAMGPTELSLQYAIVGAPETLAVTATVTPVGDAARAQAYVDRLPSDPLSSGTVTIDGLPVGAQVVHYDDGGAPRLVYAQFVAKGALNEITCSDLSITIDVPAGRATCLAAIQQLARAMS